jgi:CheY-like chemotaxis protein
MNPVMSLRGRALLADDDPDMRHAVARVLRGLGLDVIEAEDGGRLLVAVGAHYRGAYDSDIVLIVTDVSMPVLSGLEILEGLRVAHWKQPAVVITAHDNDTVRAEARRLNAVLVPKPIDLDVLEATVLSLIG